MELEQIVVIHEKTSQDEAHPQKLVKKNKDRAFYKYSVDVVSGWLYYTPAYAIQEFLCGKDDETITQTRLIGMLVHAIVMRPAGIFRNNMAERYKVTDESSTWKKIQLNLIAGTPIQAMAYAGILTAGMVASGHYDWKSSFAAWTAGMILGLPHTIPFGWFQDKVREGYGIDSAFKKEKSKT